MDHGDGLRGRVLGEVEYHRDHLRKTGYAEDAKRVSAHQARFRDQLKASRTWDEGDDSDASAAADFPWLAAELWPDMPEWWPGQIELEAELERAGGHGDHATADRLRHIDRVLTFQVIHQQPWSTTPMDARLVAVEHAHLGLWPDMPDKDPLDAPVKSNGFSAIKSLAVIAFLIGIMFGVESTLMRGVLPYSGAEVTAHRDSPRGQYMEALSRFTRNHQQ